MYESGKNRYVYIIRIYVYIYSNLYSYVSQAVHRTTIFVFFLLMYTINSLLS